METNKLDLHWTTPEMGPDSAHIILKSFSSGDLKDLEEKWPIISSSTKGRPPSSAGESRIV